MTNPSKMMRLVFTSLAFWQAVAAEVFFFWPGSDIPKPSQPIMLACGTGIIFALLAIAWKPAPPPDSSPTEEK
jgi:hypothetical protein